MLNRILTLLAVITGMVLVAACDDSEDAPPDLGYVKVFVTSGAYTGRIPGLGLAAADTVCTDVANNSGQSGNWTAWLSDGINNINAADRIFDGGGARYQLINGTVIASNFADLTDGVLSAPIEIDESGNTVNAAFEVWTGTAVDGLASGSSCQAWTTLDPAEFGKFGRANSQDANWTDAGEGNTCDLFNRLYCFDNVVSN